MTTVLFSPLPPYLRCCVFRDGKQTLHRVQLQGNWQETLLEKLAMEDAPTTTGYVLHNGGRVIREPLSPLPPSLEKIRSCVPFLPEYNTMTLALAEFWREKWPRGQHIVLCDTAFFARLPSAARSYAIPYQLTRKGLGRYGAFGLCHQWLWNRTLARIGEQDQRLISVFLGEHPSLAAIRNGVPQDTSTGLTALEGLMSSGGCGDIDPTIVFLLKEAGLSFADINHILCNESGFTALTGRPCTLMDITGPDAPGDTALARRLLRYQIVKQIGSMLPLLGHMDTLAFATEEPGHVLPFIREICEDLAFLGLRCLPANSGDSFPLELSADDSAARVIVCGYEEWTVMKEEIEWLQTQTEDTDDFTESLSGRRRYA